MIIIMTHTPPPLMPLPVQAIDPGEYLPVPQRPRTPSVMGICSVVIGVLSILMAIATTGFALMTLLTMEIHKKTLANADESRYPFIPAPVLQAPDEIDENQADQVVDALNQAQALSFIRRQHVKQLALLHGKKLFPFANTNFTVTRLRGNISSTGQVRIGGSQTADYYVTGSGRIEVSDKNAIFRPDNGETLRSVDIVRDRSLTEDQIHEVLTWLDGQKVTVNPAQKATIQRLLRDPQQALIQRDESSTALQLLAAGTDRDNRIWFLTDDVQVRIASDGTEKLLNPDAPWPGMNSFTGKPARPIWAQMTLVSSFVSLLLGILLLIGGIFVARGRMAGRKMHLLWCMIKIPVVLAGAWLIGQSTAEWTGLFTDNATISAHTIGLYSGIAMVLIGLVWPVVVWIVMSRKSFADQLRTLN